MNTVNLTVNDRLIQRDVEGRTHLADLLRDDLLLTGTHVGCEHGICGACTVLMDGRPVRSCITYAAACSDHRISTIESFDDEPLMARLRDAFSEEHALQCGYCTPGMLITARDIVIRYAGRQPAERTIREELSGNLCRCTGYAGIVKAVQKVLAAVTDEPALLPAAAAVALPTIAAQDFDATSLEAPEAGRARGALKSEQSGARRRIESRFGLTHQPEVVWHLIRNDIKAVVACLPGARLENVGSDGEVTGVIEVRLGPILTRIDGQGVLEYDDVRRRGQVDGEGVDSRSASRATGSVEFVVGDGEKGTTDMQVALEFELTGALAQFSRGALVDDVVQVMLDQFRANLDRQLSGGEVAATAQLNPMRLFLSALARRLRRWFGGGR